jgi:uncharacterized protein YpmB
MKTILFTLGLLFSTITFSQNSVYDENWYQSLEEPINFITFKKPCGNSIQFRIYRGSEETYKVTLINSKGKEVCRINLRPEDEIDVSNLYHGVYYLKAEDSKGNSITKEIIIG